MKTDEQLMRELQDGDKRSLEELYHRHSERMWTFISYRLPPQLAEDIFQDLFIKLVEKKHFWRGQPFILWFYVLARHLVTDQHRHQKVEKKYLTRLENADHQVQNEQGFRELIQGLPTETSLLMEEVYREGFTYEELAEKYEVSEISLRKKISRALGLLRKGVHHDS